MNEQSLLTMLLILNLMTCTANAIILFLFWKNFKSALRLTSRKEMPDDTILITLTNNYNNSAVLSGIDFLVNKYKNQFEGIDGLEEQFVESCEHLVGIEKLVKELRKFEV